ncbi:histone deacetylase family protein [Rhizobium laguerreae]|uniref:histone deacetylase family protein n=1 Tax=Rhizobium laguerreae TaxID=1076926 RepID=UPI0014413856|nr:histone deacetylase family protein [Rhizobium laguerreae]NKM31872.1 histone deacetylase family protein [Rhizobium laguerreae]
MKVVYSDLHRSHVPGDVVENGVSRPSRDVPERMDAMLRAVKQAGLEVVGAADHGLEALSAVHSAEYLSFLASAYGEWKGSDLPGRVVPAAFETRPEAYRDSWSIVARAGFHLRDQITPVGEGTWDAAYWAAQTAITAADLVVNGERQVYALCRPSGHHAGPDYGGGATYLNNAAIAARRLAADGKRIAIVDLDVHHGNGTQDIFWDDANIFFASIHRSPVNYYPHFTGFREEMGGMSAEGANMNHPLAKDGGDEEYLVGAEAILDAALEHNPAAVVVSLGFDALASDPAKGLSVTEEAFEKLGRLLGGVSLPVMLVQEGGYDPKSLQHVAARFLDGFCSLR